MNESMCLAETRLYGFYFYESVSSSCDLVCNRRYLKKISATYLSALWDLESVHARMDTTRNIYNSND